MDDQFIIGIASVVSVLAGLAVHYALQSRKNQKIGVQIEAALGEKGPRTLRELSEDVGRPGILGRGNTYNALAVMVREGRVEAILAPEGTPQLEKVNFIRYKLRASSAVQP